MWTLNKWTILIWKAVLMRKHSFVISILEIFIPVIFSLQIRIIFEPAALNLKDFNNQSRDTILKNFPRDIDCRYAPKNEFVDQLMTGASELLQTAILPASNEKELVMAHKLKNLSMTSPMNVIWAIFELQAGETKPEVLNYKIRSTEISGKRSVAFYDEEPTYDDFYMNGGFLAMQIAIEESFLQFWKTKNLPISGRNWKIGRIPYHKYNFIRMLSTIRPNISLIYYLTVISLMLLPIATIYKTIHDKETGFKNQMRILKISPTQLYVGWIIYLIISALPTSILCTFILCPVYSNASPILLGFFIITYIVMSSVFMFAIGIAFHQSGKAVLTCILVWISLAHITLVVDEALVDRRLLIKFGSLILPHSGLLYGLAAFTSITNIDGFQSEERSHGFWKLFYPYETINRNYLSTERDIIQTENQVSLGMVIIAWIVHIAIWFSLTIYLDNVNPCKLNSAKPWYYPCKRKSEAPQNINVTYRGTTNWSAVERTPMFLEPIIRVRRVAMNFGKLAKRLQVLRDMSIDFYRNEFNVILGNNGSGKSTFLKIITGLYKPTQGHVYIEGRDFASNEIEVENTIGYCPQENILVNYLTALQHIYLFGMMKGMNYKAARKEALYLVQKLGLIAEKDLKLKDFSFGTQRRICLAMAVIGQVKVLILDEPTYGIDTQHKRLIWDLLSIEKNKKTIIMATNSMEAADILADRIAIIVSGRIECYGSKMYLHRRYGIGYVLSFVIQENCDLTDLQNIIQEYAPKPVLFRGIIGKTAKFNVPRGTMFSKLLHQLETKKVKLKFTSFSLTSANVEGLFLRIDLLRQLRESRISFPSHKFESMLQERRRNIIRSGNSWSRITGRTLWRQQVVALLYKKYLHAVTFWKFYLFSIIFSLFTLALTMMISRLGSFSVFKSLEVELNVTKYTSKNLKMLYHTVKNETSQQFLDHLKLTSEIYDRKTNFHISKDVQAAELMIHPNLHSIEFKDRYFMSIDILHNDEIEIMHSPLAIHSGPIAVNLLHNTLLQYQSDNKNLQIKLKYQPITNLSQWQHRLVHPRNIRNWENAAILISLFLVIPSIDLGTSELQTLMKQLQFNMYGVTTTMYWMTMYCIDMIIYMISLLVISLISLAVYYNIVTISASKLVQVFVISVCYGGAAIPMGYCVQLLVNRSGSVYLVILMINIFTVLMVNASVILPVVMQYLNETLRFFMEVALHILPPYVLACAISNYITLSLVNWRCFKENNCGTEFSIEDPCCYNCGEETCYNPLNVMLLKQSGSIFYHSIADDLLVMISQAFCFNLLLFIFETKNRRKWCTLFPSGAGMNINPSESEETDVLDEENVINDLIKEYEEKNVLSDDAAVIVQNLSKKYDRKPVVKGVSFKINKCDCFGLLGMSGSGKSTIFRLLTGQTNANTGKAVICGFDLVKDDDMCLSMTGYCPQTGGINQFLTGRQTLSLFAALRGMPREAISNEVDKWLDVFDLLDFENLRLKNCPWGVQRKICVLQSLIGDPPIVFLDEPSSGIDIVTRNAFCEIVHQVRELGRSLLVTTQSIEEAEAFCLRVGILINGRFVSTGTIPQLKEKYGDMITITIGVHSEFTTEALDAVRTSMEECLSGVKLKNHHLGTLTYELGSNIPYSSVFERLENLRQKHSIVSDFSVNQQSLEEMFLELTRRKVDEDAILKRSCYRRLIALMRDMMQKR